MAASDKELGELHKQLTRVFAQMLEPVQFTYMEETGKDEDGEPTYEERVRVEYPAPAVLNAARAFLKDNSITVVIESDPEMDRLVKQLQGKGKVSDADVAEALKGYGSPA